jgi:2-keto-4-pentenoate hydratase/2-oxohepta-3-ene-1,7-dioic acid hydratase in catechol pathway
LRAALAGDALGEIRAAISGKPTSIPIDRVSLLPVIPNPDKIICIGLNYPTHVAETRRPDSKHPSIFTRFADTQVGHGRRYYGRAFPNDSIDAARVGQGPDLLGTGNHGTCLDLYPASAGRRDRHRNVGRGR